MNRWIKHLLIYGFGTILLNAIPFFLIPIYTRAVSVGEYGVLELLNRSQDFVLLIITMGMASTLATLYQMEESLEGKRRLYSTAIIFLGLTSLALLLPLGLAAKAISRALFTTDEYALLVVLFLAATYFEIIFQMAALFLQSELKSTLYVTAYGGRAFLSLGMNAVFAFVFHLGLLGIALATLSHTIAAAAVVGYYSLSRTGLHFGGDKIRGMLRFGLPLVPGALAMFVLNNGDRYFLNIFSSRAAVGIYSVGYKLAAATSTLVLMPFLKIWSVKMVDVCRRDDGPIVMGKIATLLTGACIFVTLGMSLFAPYLLRILTSSPTYEAAVPIIPIVGLSYVFYAWSVVMDSAFYVTKRTELKPLALLISCAVILPVYYFLIKGFGMMGAAWATLVGFGVFAGVTYIVGQRVYRAQYEFGRMSLVLTVAGVALFLAEWSGTVSWLNFGLRALLLGLFIAIVWKFIVDSTERSFVRQQWESLFNRFSNEGRAESVQVS